VSLPHFGQRRISLNHPQEFLQSFAFQAWPEVFHRTFPAMAGDPAVAYCEKPCAEHNPGQHSGT
jgi:hypothetical protein